MVAKLQDKAACAAVVDIVDEGVPSLSFVLLL